MKKWILIALVGVSAASLSAKHFWRGKTLSAQEVAQKWGVGEFDTTKFKTGDEKVRASMAYSAIIKKKDFVGKLVTDIRQQLGAPDGYYFSDVFPAYMIYRGQGEKEDSWQLVFLLSNERRVSDVIVHKNCCE